MQKTVASFDPKFIEALRVGSRQTLRIPLATYGQAHRLRSCLHSLRAALKREKSPLCIATDKTQISISAKHAEVSWLEIRPADNEYADILAIALADEGTLQPTSIVSSEPTPEPQLSELARSIRDVVGKDE